MDRADRADRNNGNVAIKREQRLLADFAEHKQRKDCEAGLIIGIIGNESVGRVGRVGKISTSAVEIKQIDHWFSFNIITISNHSILNQM